MKISMKLIKFMLIVIILSSFGLCFCIFDNFTEIHKYLLNISVFSIFKGQKSIVIGLLSNVCVTAWFTMIGFIINYFDKKKKLEEDTKELYLQIRDRCYDKIIYDESYFESNPDETYSILEYLNSKKYIVYDYYRPILRIRVKLHKIKNKETASNHITHFTYFNEDVYALILNTYSQLLQHFYILYTFQTQINENLKIIDICNKKNKMEETDDLKKEIYNTHLKTAEEYLKINREGLEKAKINKEDFYERCFAIETNSKDNIFVKQYTCEILFPDETLND